MKKGFTLIEMIGVMVILSLLLLFVMPSVINYIKKGGDTKDTVVKTMIFEAAKKYIDDNNNMFKKDVKNTYCISLYTLANEGYIESPVTLSSSDEDIASEESTKTVKVTYSKKFEYELTDDCHGIVNPTPVLAKGLTPVIYDEQNENWKVVDKNDPNWYDYDEQKWANAVVLGTGVTKQVGDTVAVDGTEAKMMLVWIPRYEYKIEGDFGKHSDGTNGTEELPGEIKVNFIVRNTKTATEGYHIHPAFDFDGVKSGFWVGKFEISHTEKSLGNSETDLEAKFNCTDENCSEAQYLRILPNKSSLRYNDVSNFFYAIRSIENTQSFGLNNMDTHMIKNSEWGAVAYLSQSKYGKYGNDNYDKQYKEVYQNKSDNYITGSSNGTPSQDEYRDDGQCTYNDMTNLGEDSNGYKKGQCGPGASTTGNIYGVYDMSGGSNEVVMGIYMNDGEIYSGYDINNNSGFYGKTGKNNEIVENGSKVPSSIYYDGYMNETDSVYSDATKSCNNQVCYGHALSETRGWYKNTKTMVNSNFPWFVRGDNYFDSQAGIFSFINFTATSHNFDSTRVIIFNK